MRASETAPRLEWLYALCCLFFTFGLFVDGWAHNHLESSLETFFTPWHAMFYAGYFLCVAALGAWVLSWRDRFGSLIDAVPHGHGLSLIGAAIFFLGGIGDMLWHQMFGIEADIEALLSPTHLVLAIGMTLMLSGGMRQFWATRHPGGQRGFFDSFPYLLSVTLTTAVILFMVQYGQFTEPQMAGVAPRDPFYPQAVSLLGALIFTMGFSGALVLLLRRDRLPFGSVTFVLTMLAAGFSVMREGTEAIPAAMVAGFVGDLWLQVAETRVARMTGLRIFFFLVPAVYYVLLLSFIALRHDSLWWSAHLLAGMPVLMGIAGLITSFIAWPPRQAVERAG